MHAQSSCAANFIYENLWEGWDGELLHVDLAGPATDKERGTGFGVALALGCRLARGRRAVGKGVRTAHDAHVQLGPLQDDMVDALSR